MMSSSGRRLVYFNSYPRHTEAAIPADEHQPLRLTVAISAQTGSGALEIADQLAEYLTTRARTHQLPWRVLGKTLMAEVLKDHHLPPRLAKFLPEDANNTVNEVLDELLGLHPPSSVIAQQSIETVLNLARAGNIILVGWGVNAITHKLPNVFHVRVVGSMDRRVARIRAREHLTQKEALAFLQRSDRARARYVKKHFQRQVSDLMLYDLIVNTDRISDAEAVRIIADAVLHQPQVTGPGVQVVAASDNYSPNQFYGPRRHQ